MILNDLKIRFSRRAADAGSGTAADITRTAGAGHAGAANTNRAALNTARASRVIELITRFSIAFTLSGTSIFSGMSPFAAAFAASSGGGLGGLAALLGAALGYLMFCPFLWALKYISAALLAVAAGFVFRPAAVSRSEWFMPGTAGAFALFVGIISASDGGITAAEAVFAVSDAVLCLGCTYFYKTAFSPWSWRLSFENEVTHTVSVLVLLSTALISLSGLSLFGIMSIGRAAAVLAVLLAAYKGGAGMGCASGLALGLALDAASGAAPVFAAAYGIAGLTAGIFSGRGRLAFALAFVLADGALAVFAVSGGAVPAILYESFAASVVFILLPSPFISRVGAFLPERGARGSASRAREYTRRRVAEASLAFRELYDTAKTASGGAAVPDDPAVIFDRAADAVCRSCEKAPRCWQEEYGSTRDVMNNLTPVILRRGSVETADYPDYFAAECVRLDGFTRSVNSELRSFLHRRQLKSRLRGSRDAAYSR
ncbi:MAG: hypothetical protein LBK23_02035, partial [Oscillospiraceae bacterium]|nr:hypothetical protein [Oscillospiraceae bacterium]